MSAGRKPLEALTLDKLIGRFHKLEDENARMRPVVDAARWMAEAVDDGDQNEMHISYSALLAEVRKMAAEPFEDIEELGEAR